MFFNINQNTRWEGGKTGEGGTANETRRESARAMNKNSNFNIVFTSFLHDSNLKMC